MSDFPKNLFEKDSHCSYCGTKFLIQNAWPRKCYGCLNDSWKNPIPIIVAMVPVKSWTPNGAPKFGLLTQIRNIEPQKGGLALPGGYINHGETWQQAAARENEEEVGLPQRPDDYELCDIRPAESGNMLIFCNSTFHIKDFDSFNKTFVPNEEVRSLDVYWGQDNPQQLCFPTHRECADLYIAQLNEAYG